MATKTKIAEDNEEKENKPFYNAARRILLAGIGAIALTHDEIEDFVDKLVERGEIAKKDGESLIKEVADRRKKTAQRTEKAVNSRLNEVLDHFNIPTKSDFDQLSEKIATLAKKVDELKKPKE